jgi:hypothetical protein
MWEIVCQSINESGSGGVARKLKEVEKVLLTVFGV